jgi:two-component system, chemotaxis family, protein-glutamate methylesterase/glutaminase
MPEQKVTMLEEGSPPAVVAVAASAGGLAALTAIFNALPADFAAPILAMIHLDPHARSCLAQVLGRRTALRVLEARDGVRLQPGVIYVAPPDRHLCVDEQHCVRLTDSAPVHHARPSADELFRSVAEAYGAAAVGVICTGTGMDGTAGLTAMHERGGTTIAQDRATSQYFGMPGTAIREGAASLVLPLQEIPGKLVELVGTAPA